MDVFCTGKVYRKFDKSINMGDLAVRKEDDNWIDTAKALERIGSRSQTVLAPLGFHKYFPGVLEYKYSDNLSQFLNREILWFVVFKTQLPQLQKNGLIAILIDSRIIYSNQDFTVFMLASSERRASFDVASFVQAIE